MGADPEMTLARAGRWFFSFPTPRVGCASLVALGAARLWAGAPRAAELLLAIAIAIGWLFLEWVLHRFLMHMKPLRVLGRTIDPSFARNHREHHRRPWEIERTFLTPPFVLAAPIVAGGAAWPLGPGAALTAAITLLFMVMTYNWIHFLAHARYQPKTRLVSWVTSAHLSHHLRSDRTSFAFTLPWIDVLLRTAPDRDPPRETRSPIRR